MTYLWTGSIIQNPMWFNCPDSSNEVMITILVYLFLLTLNEKNNSMFAFFLFSLCFLLTRFLIHITSRKFEIIHAWLFIILLFLLYSSKKILSSYISIFGGQLVSFVWPLQCHNLSSYCSSYWVLMGLSQVQKRRFFFKIIIIAIAIASSFLLLWLLRGFIM